MKTNLHESEHNIFIYILVKFYVKYSVNFHSVGRYCIIYVGVGDQIRHPIYSH